MLKEQTEIFIDWLYTTELLPVRLEEARLKRDEIISKKNLYEALNRKLKAESDNAS